MPAHLCVKELRYDPRYPADIKTRAIFHRRHIQWFLHCVYIHINGNSVNRFFRHPKPERNVSPIQLLNAEEYLSLEQKTANEEGKAKRQERRHQFAQSVMDIFQSGVD